MNVVNAYFEKKLQEIREDDMQLAAYKAVNNTVVIAGPGSGKTTVLTLKVMQLLAEVIYPPRGLACLTYAILTKRWELFLLLLLQSDILTRLIISISCSKQHEATIRS